MTTATAILLVHGALRPRFAATLAEFVYRHGGRIVYHDQYVDRERQRYFSRLEWELQGFDLSRERIGEAVREAIAHPFGMAWRLYFSDVPPRLAIFVSKLSYCLYDIIGRQHSGEWQVEIPLIVSNHPDLEDVARRFQITFHCFPITPANKQAQEERQLALLRQHEIELVVLARYSVRE